MILDASERHFEPFSLTRLMRTCFGQGSGEELCILIDLPDPVQIKDFAFLNDETLSIQNYGYEYFYKRFQDGALKELNFKTGDIFAYAETGGSNLDMDDECWGLDGKQLSLKKDIYSHYGIILCVSTFSATAPLTAECKNFGFRGSIRLS